MKNRPTIAELRANMPPSQIKNLEAALKNALPAVKEPSWSPLAWQKGYNTEMRGPGEDYSFDNPADQAAYEAGKQTAREEKVSPQSRKKPGIRVPKKREPNKTEAEYRWKLYQEFGHPGGPWEIKYEAISFKLPGGLYTPDWSVWRSAELILAVECKGSYRLNSAGASHRAFKEAAAAWPKVIFRYAKKNKEGTWEITELNNDHT